MIHIMLVCAQGMSTSLLVLKMEEAARSQEIEAEIWATGNGQIQDEYERADIIMLGPQVRFRKKAIEEQIDRRCPVAAIDMSDYGMINGAAVLKKAMEIVNENK